MNKLFTAALLMGIALPSHSFTNRRFEKEVAHMELKKTELQHGERFGKLTVLGPTPNDKRGRKYRCGCVCGGRVRASAKKLMSGEVKSCGRCDPAKL